jgi:hypothetical protein
MSARSIPWRVYLDRYLNVPPARLPPGGAQGISPSELRRAFLDACDRQQQVAEATRLAAAYLSAGYPAADFIAQGPISEGSAACLGPSSIDRQLGQN